MVTGPHVAAFVSEKLGTRFSPPYTTLGLERDGQLVTGIVFNCYTGHDIEINVAGSELPRSFLKRAAKYCFEECSCIRVTITTEQEHVIDLAHRLLAQTEGRKRNHFGAGRDGVVLGILREDWKFR